MKLFETLTLKEIQEELKNPNTSYRIEDLEKGLRIKLLRQREYNHNLLRWEKI